jgi:hypothetical protein
MSDSKTKIIRDQNDRFRKGDASIPGTVVVTVGVQELLAEAGESFEALATKVREFDDFNAENDPHQEHDLGKFSFCEAYLFWKIDQYNTSYDGGSEDPSDLSKTCRVLTIMLTHEY